MNSHDFPGPGYACGEERLGAWGSELLQIREPLSRVLCLGAIPHVDHARFELGHDQGVVVGDGEDALRCTAGTSDHQPAPRQNA